ncbi:AraC-like DNA-binding protein [Bradyrhizobium japonicum]|uniref:AraC family transcriptional regulator n=1 Tax=Bradyrhizobium elkanii TaxID=29448 RepID=UPI0003758A57|nr:AraC family transcriptional regulator [Bradyrhizobium elkanii]MBP2434876.1 AraC-like DNA-binding protein [Bradyrhizobium elkanii]MCP1731889.1 AraC-like DNA-binding protein [Bradyrhizobium elkanii]MCS3567223.1 AraC-like DNA-binding protein [Bradyrhizobium elkanii]MCS3591291.1 AraC-like DNA-binding protein [Bradyrhizobium elkanii]MCS3620735.1 AraC-like DNA-binding protein [Bradyrhizobium elkanii]
MEGRQRVGALVELPQVLRELGKDPAGVIAGAGINLDLLRNPENSISFIELGRLIEAGVAATGCQHFGFLVGQRSGTASLGLVGRLMHTAPTLKDAILDLCTNQRRYVRGAVTYLVIQDDVAFWGYAVHYPGVQAVDQISDGAIAIGFNMMRELVGAAPEEVRTSRRTPSNVEPYRRFFGFVPRFDAEQHALVFPASLLDRPVRGANGELRRILEKSIAAYWAVEQPCVTDTVTRMLRARVIFPDVSLEEVASELSVRPRTLNRRLQAEGKSFRELVNQSRFEVARQLLAGTRMDITDIALALGYAELSGFSHAFQRWSGVAPSEWRSN